MPLKYTDRLEVKIASYMHDWGLLPDGELFTTRSSILQPVIFQKNAAMLKVPIEAEERRSLPLLDWWNRNGHGAVKVFKFDQEAILMERLQVGKQAPRLAQMVHGGKDRQATEVLCKVIGDLHAASGFLTPLSVKSSLSVPDGLTLLMTWFKELFRMSASNGGIFEHAAKTADFLQSHPQNQVVLHGDIHHGNVFMSKRGDGLPLTRKGFWGRRVLITPIFFVIRTCKRRLRLDG